MKKTTFASLSVLILFGCSATPSADKPAALARLEARSGSQASGLVKFHAAGDKVRVEAEVAGLTPGEHGFHIHEVGDCSAPDATSAKGHFNPAGAPHGHPGHAPHHAGDMPNLVADASGKAHLTYELSGVTLGEGGNGILGRSVVVHASADDYRSQPAGNSGARIACGVIQKP